MARKKTKPDLTIKQIERALRKCNGLVTAAAKMLDVTHCCISHRIKRSTHLQKVRDEIVDTMLDKAENVVHSRMQFDNNLTAAIFYLKCKGKHRGYSEKQIVQADVVLTHDDWINRLDEPE